MTCRKWAHPALGSAYSRLRDLIANLQLTSMQIDDMLAELKTNSSKTEAVIACDWLKANPQVWLVGGGSRRVYLLPNLSIFWVMF